MPAINPGMIFIAEDRDCQVDSELRLASHPLKADVARA
jgi:hypothetical protein